MKSDRLTAVYLAALASLVVGCATTAPSAPGVQPGDAAPHSTYESQKPTVQSDPTVLVTSATLGSHVDSSFSVPVPKTIFKPTDNIALSVATYAGGSEAITATLGALWTYGTGPNVQAVTDDSRELALSGEDRTVFKLSNTLDWPPGQYNVEVFLNGVSVQKLGFSVR